MSSQSSKKATAVRYSEEEKKEIIDFVQAYNTANKRGGQAKAIQKYKVSAVTLNQWLKDADSHADMTPPAKKSRKAAGQAAEASGSAATEDQLTQQTAAERPVKARSEVARGRRYTSAEKNEILDFIEEYNRTHGRGGQSRAAEKFDVSVMTISSWRNSLAGSFRTRKSSSSIHPAVTSQLVAKVNQLLELGNQIRAAEAELTKLKAKFDALSATIKSTL